MSASHADPWDREIVQFLGLQNEVYTVCLFNQPTNVPLVHFDHNKRLYFLMISIFLLVLSDVNVYCKLLFLSSYKKNLKFHSLSKFIHIYIDIAVILMHFLLDHYRMTASF